MDTRKIESDFQMLCTSVTALDIKNDFISYDERDTAIDKKIDVSYKIIAIQNQEQMERKIGILDLHTNIICKGAEQKLTMQYVLRGFFTVPLDFDEDAFKKMLAMNGVVSLYSMARASISSITSQTFSIGTVILPMVNFLRFHEFEENKTE
ncbi:MAG TPA: hypothetical protein PLN48_12850 [Lachnospiraceae bacterium]|nr:hypothetical protein [Lachnospiraceae bacterium]